MESTGDIRAKLDKAILALNARDAHLFDSEANERSIACRLAMYLQLEFRRYSVDTDYNRDGDSKKRLRESVEDGDGARAGHASLVLPDIIVHTRGRNGPNLLVAEMKKASSSRGVVDDTSRVHSLMKQFGYRCGAVIVLSVTGVDGRGAKMLRWCEDVA